MPFSGRDAVVLCVLVCCVPLQYWLTRTSHSTPDQRSAEVYRLLEQIRTLANKWFSAAAWKDWLRHLHHRHMSSDYSHWYPMDDDNPLGECPAVEVWHYRSPQGTFGMSPKPRLDHPKEVTWRIGQVVRHHDFGYKGVIIGWDYKAKAPLEWILRQHKENLILGAHEPCILRHLRQPQRTLPKVTKELDFHRLVPLTVYHLPLTRFQSPGSRHSSALQGRQHCDSNSRTQEVAIAMLYRGANIVAVIVE